MRDNYGTILIVSGPSGSGKSSVCGTAMKNAGNIYFSVSCTTRQPRPGEENAVHYHFISVDEFKERIKRDEFIEYAEVHGNFYGTLRSEVIEKVEKGMDVLLDIDVQGAMQIKDRFSDDPLLAKCSELVFVATPSFDELEKRLRSRNTETEDVILRRLNNAKGELERWEEYSYLIINDDLDKAINDMTALIVSLRNSTKRTKEPGFNNG